MAYGGILNGTDREPDTCASSNFGSRRMITLTGSYGNISTFISFFLSFLCIFNARNNTTHGVYRFDNLMQVYIFCCSCQQLRSIDRQLLMQWIGKAKSKPCWMRKRKHWMRIKQRIGEAGAHRVVTAAIVFFYRFISSRVDWNGRHRAVLRWGSKKQTSVFFSSFFLSIRLLAVVADSSLFLFPLPFSQLQTLIFSRIPLLPPRLIFNNLRLGRSPELPLKNHTRYFPELPVVVTVENCPSNCCKNIVHLNVNAK